MLCYWVVSFPTTEELTFIVVYSNTPLLIKKFCSEYNNTHRRWERVRRKHLLMRSTLTMVTSSIFEILRTNMLTRTTAGPSDKGNSLFCHRSILQACLIHHSYVAILKNALLKSYKYILLVKAFNSFHDVKGYDCWKRDKAQRLAMALGFCNCMFCKWRHFYFDYRAKLSECCGQTERTFLLQY